MMRTILKVVYSRISFFLLLILISSSCTVTRTTFTHSELYTGYSNQGSSARAVAIVGEVAIIAGQKGSVSLQLLSKGVLTQKRNQVIVGVEDFRDVHCSSNGNCLLMNSGTLGNIYRMKPDGRTEKVMQVDSVFLDGMSFWDDENGLVYGDPVKGQFFLARTSDGGESWNILDLPEMPKTLENEAGFAASGTGIQTIGDSTVYFATGLGSKARIFCSTNRGDSWTVKNTPLKSGDDSYGIYSMYFWNETSGMIIGGSYLDSTYSKKICYFTNNGGKSWKNRSKGLLGYSSCIQGNQSGSVIVATGRMGTLYTLNQGKTWGILTSEPFYTCYMSEDYILLSGRNGKLALYRYDYQVELL